MERILNIFSLLIKLLAGVGIAAYGMAALVTVVDIIGRKIGFPIRGVVDLVQLFIVTGAWLVMPFAFMAGTHVSVDFVVAKMPMYLRSLFRIVATLLAIFLIGLMLWQGYLTYETRTMFGDTSQQLGIPIAWYWYSFLIGLAMSLIAVVLNLIFSFKKEQWHG